MIRPTIRIPPDWSVGQALAVVEFLQTITDTIWDVHGDAMAGLCPPTESLDEALEKDLQAGFHRDLQPDPPPVPEEPDIPW